MDVINPILCFYKKADFAILITGEEKKIALELGNEWGIKELEETAPISFVGTGVNLNDYIPSSY